MQNIENIIIETDRLLLVPTTQEYAQDIFNEFTEEITRLMFPKPAKHIEETQAWINSCLSKRIAQEELQMTILDKSTKEFLGNVWLHDIKTPTPELWIWVKKSVHGKKIWREAVAGLENRAQKHLEFTYIIYPVSQENIGSRKIAESLGGIVEKDEQGNEKVETVCTSDPNRDLQEVVYHIPKK